MISVAILAGGFGTRLGELARERPKALVPVNGRPFIQWQLDTLRQTNINHVVVCVSHFVEQIFRELSSTSDLKIDIVWDEMQPSGTAGALRGALPLLGDTFFVLYGDSYLTCDYGTVYEAARASHEVALMTVCREEERPNAALSGGLITYYQKNPDPSIRQHMHHIDYGLSVFDKWVFDHNGTAGMSDLSDVFGFLAETGMLAGLEWPERYHTVGTPEGVSELSSFLASRKA